MLTLARWACQIEDHYTEIRGTYSPMDIEWAKDGLTGDLFIVQARPETVQSQRQGNVLRTYHLENPGDSPPGGGSRCRGNGRQRRSLRHYGCE
jgi:pyruvate,water dikinase